MLEATNKKQQRLWFINRRRQQRSVFQFFSAANIEYETIIILLIVGFVGALLATPNQLYGLDAYIYLGYSIDFPYLFSKYGATYYSMRINHIIPQMFFQDVFGLNPGYFFYKFFQVSLAYLFFFKTLKLFKSRSIALIGAALFALSPFFIRTIGWDHYDGAAVVWQVVMIYFVLKIYQAKAWKTLDLFIVGFFASLIMNGNLFAFVVSMVPAVFMLFSLKFSGVQWGQLLKALCIGCFGFLLSYILLIQAYTCIAREGCDFFNPVVLDIYNLKTAWHFQVDGVVSNWASGTLNKILDGTYEYYFLFLPLAIAVIAPFRVSTESKILNSEGLFIAAIYFCQISGYLFSDTVGNAGYFYYFYYLSYLAPTFYLVITVLLLPSEKQSFSSFKGISCALILPLFIYWLNALDDQGGISKYLNLSHPQASMALSNDQMMTLFLLVFLVLILLASWLVIFANKNYERSLTQMRLSVSAVTLGLFVFSPEFGPIGHYNLNGSSIATLERHTRSASFELMQFVKSHVSPSQKLGFLYHQKNPRIDEYSFDSMQSTFLWGYSKFPDPKDYRLNDKDLQIIKSNNWTKLMIMGSSQQIDTGVKSLKDIGVSSSIIEQKTFAYPSFTYQGAMLNLSWE